MAGLPSALSSAQKAEAEEFWETGETASAIGARFGVSKSTICGMAHRGDWSARRDSPGPEPLTLFDRCNALHAAMDAGLAATMNVGRVPNKPPPPR